VRGQCCCERWHRRDHTSEALCYLVKALKAGGLGQKEELQNTELQQMGVRRGNSHDHEDSGQAETYSKSTFPPTLLARDELI